MTVQNQKYRNRSVARNGFTLVELLMVISVIAILSSLAVAVVRSAEGDARAARTTTVIEKVKNVFQRRIEAYETRTMPFQFPRGIEWDARREIREQVLAEWVRGELPTSMDDINNFGNTLTASPADRLNTRLPAMVRRLRNHFSRSSVGWTPENQDAECLYAILKNSWDGDNRGTHFLTPSEIGDTDGDEILEVLDGWGDPLVYSISDAEGNAIDPANPITLNDYRFEIESTNARK